MQDQVNVIPPNSQQKVKGLITFSIIDMLMLLVVGLVGFGLGYLVFGNNSPIKSELNTNQLSQTNTPKDFPTPTKYQLHKEYYPLILSPKNGDVLCMGKTFDIKWQAPKDMATVTLIFKEKDNTGFYYTLGSFPGDYDAVNNSGVATYHWKVGYNREGKRISPSPAYEIIITGQMVIDGINTQLSNANFDINNGGIFTITNC